MGRLRLTWQINPSSVTPEHAVNCLAWFSQGYTGVVVPGPGQARGPLLPSFPAVHQAGQSPEVLLLQGQSW